MLIRAGSGTRRAQRWINSKVGRRRDEMEGVEVEVTHPKGNTTHEHVRLAVKDRQEWFWLSTQLKH